MQAHAETAFAAGAKLSIFIAPEGPASNGGMKVSVRRLWMNLSAARLTTAQQNALSGSIQCGLDTQCVAVRTVTQWPFQEALLSLLFSTASAHISTYHTVPRANSSSDADAAESSGGGKGKKQPTTFHTMEEAQAHTERMTALIREVKNLSHWDEKVPETCLVWLRGQMKLSGSATQQLLNNGYTRFRNDRVWDDYLADKNSPIPSRRPPTKGPI